MDDDSQRAFKAAIMDVAVPDGSRRAPAPVPVVLPLPAPAAEGEIKMEYFTVVGFAFNSATPSDLAVGTLRLDREPDNKYDSNAIRVLTVLHGLQRSCGYIAKSENTRLIDKTILSAEFSSVSTPKTAIISVRYK